MAKRKNKSIKNREIYYFVIFLVSFVLLLALLFYLLPVESESFIVTFNVDDKIGVDVNNSAITFGDIFPGGTSTKKVFIDNPTSYAIRVLALPDENLSEFILVERETIIESGKNYSLPVQVVIPENASFGKHEGRMRFLVFRKTF